MKLQMEWIVQELLYENVSRPLYGQIRSVEEDVESDPKGEWLQIQQH